MKKFISIAIISIFALLSCNIVAPIFNPIIGTWKTPAVLGTSTTYVFSSNGACSESTTVLGIVGATKTGVWTNTSTTITIQHWSDSSANSSFTYSFGAGNSTMTLVPTGGGLSLTYTRQ